MITSAASGCTARVHARRAIFQVHRMPNALWHIARGVGHVIGLTKDNRIEFFIGKLESAQPTTSCCNRLRSTATLLRLRTSLANFFCEGSPARFASLEGCVVGPEMYDLEDKASRSCCEPTVVSVVCLGRLKPRLLLEFLGVVVCTRPLKLRPGNVVAGGGDVVVATAALLTMAYSVLSSALWLCC